MANHFVVTNTPLILKYNNLRSILFIELLVYIVLIIVSLISAASYYCKSPQKHKNLLALKKLGDALKLARSLAITTNSDVGICSSSDFLNCNDNWGNDLIIFNDLVVLHHITLQFSTGTLKFFGKQNIKKINFLPSGLTNNNGHFCIDSHCLYINKAGRINYGESSHS